MLVLDKHTNMSGDTQRASVHQLMRSWREYLISRRDEDAAYGCRLIRDRAATAWIDSRTDKPRLRRNFKL